VFPGKVFDFVYVTENNTIWVVISWGSSFQYPATICDRVRFLTEAEILRFAFTSRPPLVPAGTGNLFPNVRAAEA